MQVKILKQIKYKEKLKCVIPEEVKFAKKQKIETEYNISLLKKNIIVKNPNVQKILLNKINFIISDLIKNRNNLLTFSTLNKISIFNPYVAYLLIYKYTNKNDLIINPFAGSFSIGGIAGLLDRKYIGTELDPLQYKFNITHNNFKNVLYYNDDGNNLYKYVKVKVDCVMTCPPYYNLEKYTDLENDLSNAGSYEEFIKKYKQILLNTNKLLKIGGKFIIIIGDVRNGRGYYPFVTDTLKILRSENHLLQKIIYQTPTRVGAFGRNNKKESLLINNFQYIFIFEKGKV